jgi:antitoxin CptB
VTIVAPVDFQMIPSTPEAARDVARLRWRCRRGMRELDVLLLRYLDRDWPTASSAERAAFAQLVDLQDPELFGYLVGRAEPAEGAQRAIVDAIRQLAY